MTWFRHRGDTKFCTGAPVGGSFVTLCHGRWPLADAAYGLVERHENPPPEERCGLCVTRSAEIEAERKEVHEIADFIIDAAKALGAAGIADAVNDGAIAKFAREVRRLRAELEVRTNELHLAQRELAESQDPLGTKYGAALVEAIDVAQAAGRRGWLSNREQDRLRELAKVVPQ
jgi:hypothetical protein